MHDIIVSSLIGSERELLFVGETRFEDRQPFMSLTRGLFSRLTFNRTEKVETQSVGEKHAAGCAAAHCSCKPAH